MQFYTYIKYIGFASILLITFLNEPMVINLHTLKWFQALQSIISNSIKRQIFVDTELNNQAVLFQTIHFNISRLIVHNTNVKQFYLTKIRTLPGATIWARVNLRAMVGVLHIIQILKTGALSSDCLMSYACLSLGRLTPLQRCIRCIIQP